MGGWLGGVAEHANKVHLSPAEAEIGAELGKNYEFGQHLETKVISLYEETPKQFLNPTPTPKLAH